MFINRISDQVDFEGWHTEWLTTTHLGTRYGDISLSSAHKVSALEAYLRAFDYYSNAEFFLHTNPQDPRIIQTWQNSVDSFKKVGTNISFQVEFMKSHTKE